MKIAITDIQPEKPHQVGGTGQRRLQARHDGKLRSHAELRNLARHSDEVAGPISPTVTHRRAYRVRCRPGLRSSRKTSIGWLPVARTDRRVVATVYVWRVSVCADALTGRRQTVPLIRRMRNTIAVSDFLDRNSVAVGRPHQGVTSQAFVLSRYAGNQSSLRLRESRAGR